MQPNIQMAVPNVPAQREDIHKYPGVCTLQTRANSSFLCTLCGSSLHPSLPELQLISLCEIPSAWSSGFSPDSICSFWKQDSNHCKIKIKSEFLRKFSRAALEKIKVRLQLLRKGKVDGVKQCCDLRKCKPWM